MNANAPIVLADALNRLGLTLDPSAKETVLAKFAGAFRQDETGRPFVVDEAGNPRTTVKDGKAVDQDVISFVQEIAQPHRSTGNASKPAPATTAPAQNLTEQMRFAKAEQSASIRKQIADLVAHSNPWASSTRNLTQQCFIAKHDPELAAKLKAEAGI